MKDATVSVRMPSRLKAMIEEKIGENDTMSEWICDAVSERLRHAGESHKSRFRELQVYGAKAGDGSDFGNPVERRFEQLIARHGQATDGIGGPGELDPALAVVMQKLLTDVQFRRLEAHLTEPGLTMERLAHREGASKQAIHTSIHAAMKRVLDSEEAKEIIKLKAKEQSFESGGTMGRKAIEEGEITFGRMLELVAGDRPVVGEISLDARRFHPVLARAIKPLITRSQYRRLEACLVAGMPMRMVADEEDCSLTAVSVAVARARRKLAASPDVMRALCQLYQENTGVELDTEALVAAVQARRLTPEKET